MLHLYSMFKYENHFFLHFMNIFLIKLYKKNTFLK